MSSENKCVYVFLDHRKPGKYIYDDLEFDFEPIYVGKGNLNRPNRHKILYKKEMNKFYSKIKSIIENTNQFPNYIIHKHGLNENEANQEEINLIKKIGRIDGPLTNMSDGGEGQSGWKMSDETKLKKSIAMTGKKLGPLSEETKRKLSISKTGKTGINLGSKRNDETKLKMSLAKEGKYNGKDNPNYGNKMSKTSKNTISKKNKGKLVGENNPNYKNKNHINVVAKDTWELINIDGSIIIIESLSRYCVENNLNASCMREISYGTQKKNHRGWLKVKKLTNNVK